MQFQNKDDPRSKPPEKQEGHVERKVCNQRQEKRLGNHLPNSAILKTASKFPHDHVLLQLPILMVDYTYLFEDDMVSW